MEGHDIAALSHLDLRDHPGTSEAIVTAAATGRVQALGGSLSEAEMRAVLTMAGWPVEMHDQALWVSWCESKWSPYADNGTDRGLFQMSFSPAATLRGSWFAYYGVDEALWSDPVTNALVARWAYERSGWGPWSCRP